MKWEGQEQSSNVEDRRDSGGGGGIGGRHIGIGSVVIALVVSYFFGINPLTVLGLLSGGGSVQQAPAGPAHAPPPGDKQAAFVSVVLRDTEKVWTKVFQAGGGSYPDPKLVLFRGETPTACGTGETAMGPFYCPGDSKVYLDLNFFDTLSQRMGAPGQFAQAYVVAHEVGHHVQKQLGIADKVQELKEQSDERTGNQIQVRMELQADCLAGVWANITNQMKDRLQDGDVEEALRAANSIGDDMIQKKTQGHVVPDAFTHGTAAQRIRWFKTGLDSGEMGQCDTFNARSLG